MFRNLWQRGLKDWWSVGRGWFVRALGMAAIGAAIGYLVVRLMHLQGWIVGAVAGSGAAVIWGFLTLAWTVLVGTPRKIIEEKDEALAAAHGELKVSKAAQAATLATHPNLSVEVVGDRHNAQLRVRNTGGTVERLDIRVDSAGLLEQTHFLTGSGITLHRGASHAFKVATFGAAQGTRITRWRVSLGEGYPREFDISASTIPPSRQRIPILISLTSLPENQAGPIQLRLTLHAEGWDKELLTPPPPAGPPWTTASG